MVNARPLGDGESQLSIDTVMITRVLEGTIILYIFMLVGLLGQIFISRYAIALKSTTGLLFPIIELPIIVQIVAITINRQNVMKIHYLFVGTISITLADNFAKYCGK